MIATQVRSHIPGRAIRPIKNFDVAEYINGGRIDIPKLSYNLGRLGIDITKTLNAMAMDATIQPTVTTASITTPVQFLQEFLPGFVHIETAARKIDEIVGITMVGTWSDEEVVQGVMELVGTSSPYGDYNNVPFASWNATWEKQTIVRFEEGMQVGILQTARAAKVNIDNGAEARNSAALALEIIRNQIGFYGYNSGANFTYGFLNAPGQPSYQTAANGATGHPQWSTKTFLEIIADIRLGIVGIRTASPDVIDPETTPITLALPTNAIDYLSVTADFGQVSVRKWLTDTYPKVRVVSAPQLNTANTVGAYIMFADTIDDSSTDNGRVFDQMVQTKFMVTGVEQRAKNYVEDYVNATAGVWCKRPFAVYRLSGIS